MLFFERSCRGVTAASRSLICISEVMAEHQRSRILWSRRFKKQKQWPWWYDLHLRLAVLDWRPRNYRGVPSPYGILPVIMSGRPPPPTTWACFLSFFCSGSPLAQTRGLVQNCSANYPFSRKCRKLDSLSSTERSSTWFSFVLSTFLYCTSLDAGIAHSLEVLRAEKIEPCFFCSQGCPSRSDARMSRSLWMSQRNQQRWILLPDPVRTDWCSTWYTSHSQQNSPRQKQHFHHPTQSILPPHQMCPSVSESQPPNQDQPADVLWFNICKASVPRRKSDIQHRILGLYLPTQSCWC